MNLVILKTTGIIAMAIVLNATTLACFLHCAMAEFGDHNDFIHGVVAHKSNTSHVSETSHHEDSDDEGLCHHFNPENLVILSSITKDHQGSMSSALDVPEVVVATNPFRSAQVRVDDIFDSPPERPPQSLS
jgi:hypothetical protein